MSENPVSGADRSFEDLLAVASRGDERARERVFERLYGELRSLARRRLRGFRPDGTLQPTALVHEAYLRLLGKKQLTWRNRRHFFALISRAMRDIVVEYARQRASQKRGGGRHQVTLESDVIDIAGQTEEILMLDDALSRLYQRDHSTAKVVALRYFAGLSIDEAARALGVSSATVDRRWQYAKAWLRRELDTER